MRCRYFPRLFLKNCHDLVLEMTIIFTKVLFPKIFL